MSEFRDCLGRVDGVCWGAGDMYYDSLCFGYRRF